MTVADVIIAAVIFCCAVLCGWWFLVVVVSRGISEYSRPRAHGMG